MKIHLQYGRDGMDVDLPARNVTRIEPRYVPGLSDEQAAFQDAVRRPIESPPLTQLVRSSDRVAIVVPDITRPFPHPHGSCPGSSRS